MTETRFTYFAQQAHRLHAVSHIGDDGVARMYDLKYPLSVEAGQTVMVFMLDENKASAAVVHNDNTRIFKTIEQMNKDDARWLLVITPTGDAPVVDLKILRSRIHEIACDKGFWEGKRNIGELLMLVVSELGEALEADRKDKKANTGLYHEANDVDEADWKWLFELYIKDTFEDEIADAIIRLLDLVSGLGIDIEWHINEKLKYNAARPHKHGKNY